MSVRKAFLMLVVVLLVGVELLRERWSSTAEIEKKPASVQKPERLLPDFDPEAIEEISVAGPKGNYSLAPANGGKKLPMTPITGPVKSDGWVLGWPEGAMADAEKAKAVLGALAALVSRNTFSAGEIDEKMDYGFARPDMTIFYRQAGATQTLILGKQHPVSKRRYAKTRNDPRIFLVDQEFFDALNLAGVDMRDRRPLRIDLSTVDEVLVVRQDSPAVIFKRQDDIDSWTVKTDKDSFLIDKDFFLEHVKRFLNVKVEEFIDETTQPMSVSPVMTLSIHRQNPPDRLEEFAVEVALQLTPDGQKRYFFRRRDGASIYRAPYAFFIDLLRSPEYFRERHVFSGKSASEMTSIAIRWSDKKAIDLSAASGGAWGMAEASDLRAVLSALQVLNFEPPTVENIQLAGLTAPQVEMTVQFSGDDTRYRVLLGSEIAAGGNGSAAKSADVGKPRWIGVQFRDGVLRPAIIGKDLSARIGMLLERLRPV